MSSASKGRYQSRLFNFFHKQSRRFGEGFGRSLRQLQVATSWSLEALSKSIYLLLQKAAESAGTQLPGTAGESKLYLQPLEEPSSDSAIIRVIENVETRYVNSSTNQSRKMVVGASHSLSNQTSEQDARTTMIQTSEQDARTTMIQTSEQDARTTMIQTSEQDARTTLKSSSQKIQGVASQLSSQNLVLVTSQNEILDILTPSQQQALENQIISEIANYWRSWRLSQVDGETEFPSRTNSFLKRLASGNAHTKKALPTVDVKESEHKYLQINPATVASLDTVVANLETNALAPVSRAQIIVRERGGEFIKVVRTRLDIFLYGDKQVTVSKQDIVADSNLETHPSKIQALISAAFNYFYRQPEEKKIKQAPLTPLLSSTKPNPQLQSEQSEDNWLSSADLFGNGLISNGFPQLNPRNRTSNKLNPSTKNKKSSEKLFRRFQMPNWRTLRLKERAGLVQPQKGILKSELSASTKSSERDSYIKPSERDSYIKPSERDSYIKPSERDSYIKPSERDSYIKPSERDSYIKPSERDSYIKPSEQDARTTKASQKSQKIVSNSNSELGSRSKREIAANQINESTEIEAKPEWIETKAEIVGYQKHPLEQVLAWIDNTMLKIEEAIAKFASALKQIWRK